MGKTSWLWAVGLLTIGALLGGCGDSSDGEDNNNNQVIPDPECGNGIIEAGEACDNGAANSDALPDACRTDCREAYCGDGVIDTADVCDVVLPDETTCLTLGEGYTGGELACAADCTLDTSGCSSCNNGVLEDGEECDTDNVAGETCGSLNAGQHGILRCTDQCVFDTSGCHTCHDDIIEPAEDCEPNLMPTCEEAGYSGGTWHCVECTIIGGCESVCGNGIIEPDEECEGYDLNGEDCVSLGYVGGTLSCSPACQLNLSGCSACGNGIIDADEQCDDTNLGGQTCASVLGVGFTGTPSCNAVCLLDLSGCTAPASCGNASVDAGSGEQCDGVDFGSNTCASYAPALYDAGNLICRNNCTLNTGGCYAIDSCGDGLRDPLAGEECDGADLGGVTCVDEGFPGGNLACSPHCAIDTTGCDAPPGCGNGVIDASELCDGAELGGLTCESLSLYGGTLSCSDQCTLDTSACERCGDGVVNGGEECDGQDTGGVTCQGLGFPGGNMNCSSACTLDYNQCVGESCDPVGSQYCGAGENCYIWGTHFDRTVCTQATPGAAPPGAPCDQGAFNGCTAGYSCVPDETGTTACRETCDFYYPFYCPGLFCVQLPGSSIWGYCL